MQLNPYGHEAVGLAVQLANDPPASADELARRCHQAGLVVDTPVTDRDLSSTLDLLDHWCAVVEAETDTTRAARLNRLLADTCGHPRLTDHVGTGWHLHYRPDGVPLATVLGTIISAGTAFHLAGRGIHRLGRCAVPECDRVYADTSRNGRQRYCSTRCANRDAVRRHRARQ